ncbi:MAG: response regulator, partial [Oligoflexia bacterium]|nr:response regulator [Oligoflexia bacterium]
MKKSILLIDDEMDFLECLIIRVESMGLTFDSCSSFNEAIKLLNKTSYDLIVSDIHLADACGLAIADWINKNASDTKIIFITGLLDEHDVND